MLKINIENNFINKTQAIKNAIIEIGNNLKNKAQENLDDMVYSKPQGKYKRTHNLFDRVELDLSEINKYKATVGDPMYYAVYNEYGTNKMAPRPFLRKAGFYMQKIAPFILKKWLEVFK
jgi:HK97 gp10 family phage protein